MTAPDDLLGSLGPDAVDLLHALRLRGLLAEHPEPDGQRLCDAGLAVLKGRYLALTPAGREAHAAWARLEPGSEAEAGVERGYRQFGALNAELLKICSDWQMRSGNVPNDHTDAAYDWKVIDRLLALDDRVGPIARAIARAAERFDEYRPRLKDARKRVEAGEHEWFLSPRVDSYHTVWMQLHEDILLALGLDRAEEEQANA
jgi:hypothetical protein